MIGTAFVTGSRRGIGKSIALTLARDGYDIALNDMAPSPALSEVESEIDRKSVV